jgi:hypothetical protein
VTAQQRTLAGTRNPEKEPGEGTRRRTCTDCTCGAGRNSSVTICAARRRASAAARGTAVRAAERMGAHQIILNFNDDLTKIYFHPEVEELKGRPGRECSRDQRTWTCAACRAALSSVWPTGGASVCGKGASCGRSRQGAAGAARGGAGCSRPFCTGRDIEVRPICTGEDTPVPTRVLSLRWTISSATERHLRAEGLGFNDNDLLRESDAF